MSDHLKKAYKSSQNIYDSVLTQKSFFGKLYMNVFWSGVDDNFLAQQLLSNIPDHFSGELLDVPVGTAVFTEEKWKSLSNAEITTLDYSEDMLQLAKSRLGESSHITSVQGDVGDLKFQDDSFDIVLSMNGFHAFPDKTKAYQEISRVLKPEGIFLSCFYVKGNSKLTDWLVEKVLSKKGWFTPPFQSARDVKFSLDALFTQIEFHEEGSMVYFICRKPSDLPEKLG